MKNTKRTETLRRIFALVVVFSMLFGMMDASALRAFAEEVDQIPEAIEEPQEETPEQEPAEEPQEEAPEQEPAAQPSREAKPSASLVESRGLSALLLQGSAQLSQFGCEA